VYNWLIRNIGERESNKLSKSSNGELDKAKFGSGVLFDLFH